MKAKALIFNFLGFTFLFLSFRFLALWLYPTENIFPIVIAAVLANVLAPKFGVVEDKEGKKMMMKWLLIKGIRQIK
ncbi:MAG: hypothetical protein NWP52_04645 [Flavobacteriaceae bacterium]|jgi:hypothetical protein|nr:hypothetical protein [Flavobacteriaceae bacterium]MDP4674338.1 hypothetical protein [Flavobacteriaceae bacterium]MDP4754209.1 hypothetical protein [Flavobacteriaceae bacterium]MDP4794168.1 hypothetical protein [Flavobacteriaceae bacterium]MDP4885187.1 hypothetical protein [Flavobacteriaceae bacterium]